MRSQVGAMMKKVRKSDSPMMTWLAGVLCSDKAVRTNESTMAMRMKQVMSSMIDGASVSSVIAKMTLMATSTSGAPFAPLRPLSPKFRLIGSGAAGAAVGGAVCPCRLVVRNKNAKRSKGENEKGRKGEKEKRGRSR